MEGFFKESQVKRSAPLSLVPKCGACGLLKTCLSPQMPVSGKGRRGILVVGEAPGKDEDKEGKAFVGKAGQLLRKVLKRVGLHPDNDCWFTNALICRPPNNETPNDLKIGYCRPNLTKTIAALQPNVIILLGGVAVKSLLGTLWREDPGSISKWAGWTIPCRSPNAWICPTFHPSYCARAEDPVVDLLFAQHLEAAAEKDSRPWTTIPDTLKQVRRELNDEAAAKAVDRLHKAGRPLAVDYETNMAKPDHWKAAIVSCAVSDGETAIAYPFQGKAQQATSKLLADPDVPKIAANIKFEDRWTRAILGHPVRNWWWDSMQAAHWIDNRTGITSLKFQAFVLLGQPPYDDHLRGLLKTKGGSTANQIDQIDIMDLLLYNGLDALLEVQVTHAQRKFTGLFKKEYAHGA